MARSKVAMLAIAKDAGPEGELVFTLFTLFGAFQTIALPLSVTRAHSFSRNFTAITKKKKKKTK